MPQDESPLLLHEFLVNELVFSRGVTWVASAILIIAYTFRAAVNIRIST